MQMLDRIQCATRRRTHTAVVADLLRDEAKAPASMPFALRGPLGTEFPFRGIAVAAFAKPAPTPQ